MSAVSPSDRASRPRYRSLDAFRGATVAFMILVNNPGTWSAMYEPLQHAQWHGCTPTDLVFPFFLFAVGNALAFVMHSLRDSSDASVWFRIVKRTALIFGIGLFLNAFPFFQWNKENDLVLKSFESLRFLGVLQRIAISFGMAAVIIRLLGRDGDPSKVVWAAVALLIGYWVACLTFGDAKDPYSLEGYFGTAIDRYVLGESHLYKGEGVAFDPEGIMSTFPSVAQVLFGWWVGQLIVKGKSGSELLARILLVGAYALLLAYAWQLVFPINKKIWTSTFVLFTSGLACMGLSIFIHLIDILKITEPSPSDRPVWQRLLFSPLALMVPFFEWFGKNPLSIFVLSGLVPRLLGLIRWQESMTAEGVPVWTSPMAWTYNTVFKSLGNDPRLGSLLYSVGLLAVYGIVAWWMDRQKIYIRV